MPAAPTNRPPDSLSVIVYSGDFERVHYALATVAAAAAIDRKATLFFTMTACRALTAGDPPGWTRLPCETPDREAAPLDETYRARGVAGFEELLESCIALGVRFLVCEMGLRAIDLNAATLRTDIPIEQGGLVTFLNDASADGAMLFV